MRGKNMLITGGAGFIGRWTVKRLLDLGHNVTVLDNLTNGGESNIRGLDAELIIGDIKDTGLLDKVFRSKFDVCYHLAASINVQDSIDNPNRTFQNDVAGTFNILEKCRETGAKVVYMSTCMVYDAALGDKGITELHPLKPASPYAGSKIAGESLALSYYFAYGLPVVVIRPFNTYGPFQKSGGEGGVVSIFIKNKLNSVDINIYGDGTQTRDLLYVGDCADFVVSAGLKDNADGEIINAGSGRDVSINELAGMICKDNGKIKHVPHIHPQSEIKKLLCDYEKARMLLGFEPGVALSEGLLLTEEWLKSGGF